MKKKAGLIAAVLHTPDFLILDEPFSGLDPIAAQECVDFIKMYSNSKRTILLSTHNLNYVEESADQIVVLENQSVQFDGNRSEEHTSELQSRGHLVCRLLLEKKN